MQQNLLTFLQATVALLTLRITAQGQPERLTAVLDASASIVVAGELDYFTHAFLKTNGIKESTIRSRSELFTVSEFTDNRFFISENEIRSDGTSSRAIQLTTQADHKTFSGTNQICDFQPSTGATGRGLFKLTEQRWSWTSKTRSLTGFISSIKREVQCNHMGEFYSYPDEAVAMA
jgi:hypothetical protein